MNEKIQNKDLLDQMKKDKYQDFMTNRLSQLSTMPTSMQSVFNSVEQNNLRDHAIIFERGRPQELRHTKVNDNSARDRRAKVFEQAKDSTLEVLNDV